MSNWTHVAAIARIDAIRLDSEEMMDFDKIFGKSIPDDDSDGDFELEFSDIWKYAEEHPEEFMPFGSEGGLKRVVHVNEPCHLAAYDVMIFGDLRDHHSPGAVIDWFRKACDKVWIRQACIDVINEWYGPMTWRYEHSAAEKYTLDFEDEEEK